MEKETQKANKQRGETEGEGRGGAGKQAVRKKNVALLSQEIKNLKPYYNVQMMCGMDRK